MLQENHLQKYFIKLYGSLGVKRGKQMDKELKTAVVTISILAAVLAWIFALMVYGSLLNAQAEVKVVKFERDFYKNAFELEIKKQEGNNQ